MVLLGLSRQGEAWGGSALKNNHSPATLGRQMLWFAGLWIAGVMTVSAVAFVIKLGLGI